MRTKSAQATAILANSSHSARAIVSVYDSTGTVPTVLDSAGLLGIVEPVSEVEVEQSIDAFRTARVTLQRQQGLYSLAPLVTSGNPLYSAAPVIDVGRRILIEAELQLPDISNTPGGVRETIFDGWIDEVTWPDDVMELVCSDKSAKLRDTWIETERVYAFAQGANATKGCLVWRSDLPALAVGDRVIPSDKKANGHYYRVTVAASAQATTEPTWPTGGASTVVSGGVTLTESGAVDETGTAIETVIQQVLDDNGLSAFATLQTPVSPGWLIKPYIQQRESVLDAIQAMVDQLGWWARFEWNVSLSRYELTLAEPDRTSVTVHKVLDPAEEVDCSELAVNVWSIRNAVRVIYGDSAARSPSGSPTRKVREVSDSTSIAKYGRRFMEIAEDDASMIDTSTEADRLANAVLADLKEPTLATSYSFPCDFYLELGDRITLPADTLRWSAAQTLACESLKHTFSSAGARTSVSLQGAPAALRGGWLDKDGRLNRKDVHHISMHNAVTGSPLTPTPAVGGHRFVMASDLAKGALQQSNELHISPTPGFTPDDASLVASGDADAFEVLDLVPGKTYYAKSLPFSKNATKIVRGEPSEEISFVAGRAKAGHYDSGSTQSHLPLNGNFEHASDDLTAAPFDHWAVNPTLQTGYGSETPTSWGTAAGAFHGTDSQKGKVLKLQAHATQAGYMQSSLFEIRRGQRELNFFVSVKRTGANAADNGLWMSVAFFVDSAGATGVWSMPVYIPGDGTGFAPSLSTWYDLRFGAGGYTSPPVIPTNANFARVSFWREWPKTSYAWEVGDVYCVEADFGDIWVDRIDVAGDIAVAGSASFAGAITQEAWQAINASGGSSPAFTSGFANYSGYGASTKFFKDSLGVVHLRGLVTRRSTNNTTLFTLPAGYRPAFTALLFNQYVWDLAAGVNAQVLNAIRINSSGDVFLSSNPDGHDLDIDLAGITFDTR